MRNSILMQVCVLYVYLHTPSNNNTIRRGVVIANQSRCRCDSRFRVFATTGCLCTIGFWHVMPGIFRGCIVSWESHDNQRDNTFLFAYLFYTGYGTVLRQCFCPVQNHFYKRNSKHIRNSVFPGKTLRSRKLGNVLPRNERGRKLLWKKQLGKSKMENGSDVWNKDSSSNN